MRMPCMVSEGNSNSGFPVSEDERKSRRESRLCFPDLTGIFGIDLRNP
jgi:hypothetical protein